MGFLQDKRTRALILIMGALVGITLLVVSQYYKRVNASFDPRVIEAKKMYTRYDAYAAQNDYEGILLLLDSVEAEYAKFPHYENSYEVGVLYNSRCQLYLTLAIFKDSLMIRSPYLSQLSKDTLFSLAEKNVNYSIKLYNQWNQHYADMGIDSISTEIKDKFLEGLEEYSQEEQSRFLQRRLKEMETAQLENKRRLSVSYTNLGVIYRHKEDYEEAARLYLKALELWGRNLAAENNLNILLNQPLKKRNIIQKMFPPDKDKD